MVLFGTYGSGNDSIKATASFSLQIYEPSLITYIINGTVQTIQLSHSDARAEAHTSTQQDRWFVWSHKTSPRCLLDS